MSNRPEVDPPQISISDSLAILVSRLKLSSVDTREAICSALRKSVGDNLFQLMSIGEINDHEVVIYSESETCYQSLVMRKRQYERELQELFDGKLIQLRIVRSRSSR
jgi:hypothetical protein